MKHECFIGIFGDDDCSDFVKERTLSTFLTDFSEKEVNDLLYRFDYCPICGKKIDWNELERMCEE